MAVRLRIVDTDLAAIPPGWGQRLEKLEQRINGSEGEGLRGRWEFGQELLQQRVGKKLPKGLLAAVAERVGSSPQELQKRCRFADRYPNEDALRNAVTQWTTWHRMVRDGLTNRKRKPTPQLTPVMRVRNLLHKLHGPDVTTADIRELEAEVGRLKDEAKTARKVRK